MFEHVAARSRFLTACQLTSVTDGRQPFLQIRLFVTKNRELEEARARNRAADVGSQRSRIAAREGSNRHLRAHPKAQPGGKIAPSGSLPADLRDLT